MSITDEKIFIYLRLRDDKKIMLRSRIRELAAMGKLLSDFMKEIWERYGLEILRAGSLEYVDANSDLVLISYREDIIRQSIIISGVIPKEYQKRMLDENEAKVKFSIEEFVERTTSNLERSQKETVKRRMSNPSVNILRLIKHHIDLNGEFYFTLDSKKVLRKSD